MAFSANRAVIYPCYMEIIFFFPEFLLSHISAICVTKIIADGAKRCRKHAHFDLDLLQQTQLKLKPAIVINPIAVHILKERNIK